MNRDLALSWYRHELSRLTRDVSEFRERSRAAARAMNAYYDNRGDREGAAQLDMEVESASHYLLVAVAGIRRVAKGALSLTDDHLIEAALQEFDERAQDAVHFRNFFEHQDEYIRGKGRTGTVWPYNAEMALVGGGEVAYTVHGDERRIVSIGAAAEAGLRLAERVDARIRRRPLP